MNVEGLVEMRGVFTNGILQPQWCGNPQTFPQLFPRVVHTNRDNSSFSACTFLLKEGSPAIVSSTFRIEWMTVE